MKPIFEVLVNSIKSVIDEAVLKCFEDKKKLRALYVEFVGTRNHGFCCDHIVTEDGNFDDACVDFCINQAIERRHFDCLVMLLMIRSIEDEEFREAVISADFSIARSWNETVPVDQVVDINVKNGMAFLKAELESMPPDKAYTPPTLPAGPSVYGDMSEEAILETVKRFLLDTMDIAEQTYHSLPIIAAYEAFEASLKENAALIEQENAQFRDAERIRKEHGLPEGKKL